MHQLHSYTITRTLIAEDQQTEKTTVARVQLQVIGNAVTIAPALRNARIECAGKALRIYDFQRQGYVEIHAESSVPVAWLDGDSCEVVLLKIGIPLRCNKSNSGSVSHEGERQSETSSVKKERSKERVLFEVIEVVKRWRELHQGNGSLRKMSLLEAAKALRIPKKSLDDYYYQLRLGEKCGFDFETHLFDRVGVLRAFLKKNRALDKSEKNSFDKYEKHSKSLQIIERFDLLSEMYPSGKSHRNTELEMGQMGEAGQKGEIQGMEEQGDNVFEQQQNEYTGRSGLGKFESEFEYFLDEKDPFLMGDYNFKKKTLGELDQDQLFF